MYSLGIPIRSRRVRCGNCSSIGSAIQLACHVKFDTAHTISLSEPIVKIVIALITSIGGGIAKKER